jgi:hypothetical protein
MNVPFTGIKVFSTTMLQERARLGDVITQWLSTHPELEVVDKEVRQSSDSAFHCLTITLFTRERAP